MQTKQEAVVLSNCLFLYWKLWLCHSGFPTCLELWMKWAQIKEIQECSFNSDMVVALGALLWLLPGPYFLCNFFILFYFSDNLTSTWLMLSFSCTSAKHRNIFQIPGKPRRHHIRAYIWWFCSNSESLILKSLLEKTSFLFFSTFFSLKIFLLLLETSVSSSPPSKRENLCCCCLPCSEALGTCVAS